jgi:hypothetical protein
LGPEAGAFLEAVPDDATEMFFWQLADVRSSRWVSG